MSVGIVILRILVVLVILAGIGAACYFLFFQNNDSENALQKYSNILKSDDFSYVSEQVSSDPSNVLVQYSNGVDTDFDEALALYLAEWNVTTNLMPELYFGSNQGALSSIDTKLDDYLTALADTRAAITVFLSDKDRFGQSPTDAQQQTLLNEFTYVATELADQSYILADINDVLVPFVRDNVYGGERITQYNTKYLMIEALYLQADTHKNYLKESDLDVSDRLLLNTTQILERFDYYEQYDFTRITNTSANDDFLLDYPSIDKDSFYSATDKTEYYNSIEDSNTKSAVLTVMTYLGFAV